MRNLRFAVVVSIFLVVSGRVGAAPFQSDSEEDPGEPGWLPDRAQRKLLQFGNGLKMPSLPTMGSKSSFAAQVTTFISRLRSATAPTAHNVEVLEDCPLFKKVSERCAALATRLPEWALAFLTADFTTAFAETAEFCEENPSDDFDSRSCSEQLLKVLLPELTSLPLEDPTCGNVLPRPGVTYLRELMTQAAGFMCQKNYPGGDYCISPNLLPKALLQTRMGEAALKSLVTGMIELPSNVLKNVPDIEQACRSFANTGCCALSFFRASEFLFEAQCSSSAETLSNFLSGCESGLIGVEFESEECNLPSIDLPADIKCGPGSTDINSLLSAVGNYGSCTLDSEGCPATVCDFFLGIC